MTLLSSVHLRYLSRLHLHISSYFQFVSPFCFWQPASLLHHSSLQASVCSKAPVSGDPKDRGGKTCASTSIFDRADAVEDSSLCRLQCLGLPSPCLLPEALLLISSSTHHEQSLREFVSEKWLVAFGDIVTVTITAASWWQQLTLAVSEA